MSGSVVAARGGHWEGEVWVPDEPTTYGVVSDWLTSVPWWAWLIVGWVARDVISSRASE